MKGVNGKTDEEENEWDDSISTGVKEGPAECISINEVAAVLIGFQEKKMKTRKPHIYQS